MGSSSIDVRASLETLMRATLTDTANWTYLEARPIAVPSVWHKGMKVTADCSKGVQMLCRWAHAPDPMGAAFGPYGNSQTICMNLQHLDSPAALLVGDVVTFGPDGDEHAAMVLEPGPDPLLWSFGHQGAPNTYRLSQDGREKQYLRLPAPTYIPTPEDRLRARTGWFAWVAWRLAQGDWRPYGKAVKRVRPNVPRVIPPSWWRRYARFLANRSKPNRATTS